MPKTCIKCKITKELSEFHKNKRISDRHSIYCKECKAKKAHKYNMNNKEKEDKRKREWRKKNIDRLRKRERVYNVFNKERQKKYNKAWRANNPEKCKVHDRENYLRYRAKKLEVQENYTKQDEQYTLTLFQYKCVKCGSTETLNIDHHNPLSKGNALTRQNAVVLCRSCNCSKGDKNPEEFYEPELLRCIEEQLNS